MPTISYIGRLVDSRKGLAFFIDAVELLLGVDLPPFRVRIVGGTTEEAADLEATLMRATKNIRDAIEIGRVEVWSRVDGYSLPEIYSRSTVICLPSLREQFGMVAVEAMMCGTPVVATRTGGLQDIVAHDVNGYLVDRLNAPGLAAALAQFIRNDRLGHWMGGNAALWSRDRFSLDSVVERYLDLYEELLTPSQGKRVAAGLAVSMNEKLMAARLPAVERLLGCRVDSWTDVSSSPTPSFLILSPRGEFFLKLHQERPPSLTCLVLSPLEAEASPIAPERVRMARLLTAAPVAPRVVAADEGQGLLLQERLLEEPETDPAAVERLMLAASRQFQNLIVVKDEEASAYLAALDGMSMTTDADETVRRFDQAAALLSSRCLGGKPRLRKCHPQIELLRLAGTLERDAWTFPPEFGLRARGLLRFLATSRPFSRALPRLQHGSMKRDHLMRRVDGSSTVCDLDHAGFYVGPHDIAHWFHDQHACKPSPAPQALLYRMAELAETEEELFLGALWLVIFSLFNAQWRFARGDWRIREWDMQFLSSYQEAFCKVLTR